MPDRNTPRPATKAGRGALPQIVPANIPDIIIDDPAWRRALPRAPLLALRAARAAGGAGTLMLASDRTVRVLNRTHRGQDHATNVLTFPPAHPGQGGDIVLAYGVMARQARIAGRPLAHHLAHLVVHAALHLQGHDHHHPADARAMEMAESRILHRLRIPNPWKPRPLP